MNAMELEKRLTAVEQEVARLKSQRAPSRQHPVEALERIHGTFENDEAAAQAMALGRKWRRAQRPKAQKKARGK
jgi:hypothetical protein